MFYRFYAILRLSSGCLNANVDVLFFFVIFPRLTICNPSFVLSVAVKKARFVCEDGSYYVAKKKKMRNVTSYEGGNFRIHLFSRFVSRLLSNLYTSEILSRAYSNRILQIGIETSREIKAVTHASLLKSANNLLHPARLE